MKILNAQQIKEVDACSIQMQIIESIDLMERAATVFYRELLKYIRPSEKVHIFCGKGNNGGDGLAISRMLLECGFNVGVIIVEHTNNTSKDFSINYDRLLKLKGFDFIIEAKSVEDLKKIKIDNSTICVDAILGSGVNKPSVGIIKDTIDFINQNYRKIFSVDVPSGLFLDKLNDKHDSIIRANYTFTFQLPKLSFLFPENAEYTGEWKVLDIGLSSECIEKHTTNFFAIDKSLIKTFYKKRSDVSAKWDYGHCLIIAGSYSIRGAAVMCAGSALRSGCGLVSVHSVQSVLNAVIQKYPECILSIDKSSEFISSVPELKKYNAIAIGSGMGCNSQTADVLRNLLECKESKKLVIDADGLNCIAQNKELLKLFTQHQIILTPHIKEFDRIFGTSENHFERLQKAMDVAKEHNCVIVLKSAYTAVVLPSQQVYFSIIANSGLAKGGSGDVLTGLIAGLCARGYNIDTASILGVYIHSMAGYIATREINKECLLPTDVINYFSEVFNEIQDEKN